MAMLSERTRLPSMGPTGSPYAKPNRNFQNPSNQHVHEDYECLMRILNSERFIKEELTFDVCAFSKKIKAIKPNGRTARLEKKLDDIFCTFRREAIRKKAENPHGSYLKRMLQTTKRLATPTVNNDEDEERRRQAIITLQKVIRGRTVQKSIREDIQNNIQTILELKALHRTDPNGLNYVGGENVENIYREQDEFEERENEVTEITDQMEGDILGRMLEFLEKEMVRLLDEDKVHELMMLADKERRERETVEIENRKKEEIERRTIDEIYKEVSEVHQSSVDMYLEDIFLESIERAAEEEAESYVQELAASTNNEAYLNNPEEENEQRELARDIVNSFILPEMDRIEARRERSDNE